jgi:uncharacterized membrane protein
MKMHTRYAIVSCFLVLAGACGSDAKGPECPPTKTSLTYTNFGQAFMTTYCASCHAGSVTGAARQGAPTGDVFDTLSQIHAKSDDIIHEVAVEKSMPYGAASKKPTDAERQQLGEWLACGGAQ